MALMAEAISEAKTEKYPTRVTLKVRRSNLTTTRSLYRKLNFEERRLRTNYYGPGEDAIVMELHLDGARRARSPSSTFHRPGLRGCAAS